MYYENFDRIEKFENKDTLLICIGDSWTWGDSLSDLLQSTSHMHEEILMGSKHSYAERKEKCYGNHLSNYLNSDWLNIAFPGESNYYILEKLKECIVCENFKKYKKIYYVIVLTETGRELRHLDKKLFKTCKTLDQMLETSESWIYKEIQKLDLDNLIVTRNFTKSYHQDRYKSWLEINAVEENLDSTDCLITGFITQKALRDNKKIISKIPSWRSQVLKQYDKAEQVFSFLSNSKYHHQKSTKHPTKESHVLWARYLYKIIQEESSTSTL